MKSNLQFKILGEICDFKRGLTYSKKDEINFSDNVVIRANNINLEKNTLDFSDLKYIKNDIKVPKDKKVKLNSIIICTASGSKNHLGKVAFIENDYGYAFGSFLGMLTPKKEILSKYIFYNLISDSYKKFISKLSDGLNINNLKFDYLKNYMIFIPPFYEQQRIVKIMDEVFEEVDKVKENAEKNLLNARELFESYLQNIFVKPSEGWEEKRLKEIGQTQTGTTPKTLHKKNYGNFIPFIKPADIDIYGDGVVRYDNEGLSKEGLNVGRTIKSDSILMVCIGASIGKVGFTDRDVSCNQQINALSVKNVFEAKFFYYALKTKRFYQKVLQNSSQATLPIINKSKWENLSIKFPETLVEQKAIVSKLDSLAEETKKLENIYKQKLTNLVELKKSILKKAFSGEL